jgi:hypothetical protein
MAEQHDEQAEATYEAPAIEERESVEAMLFQKHWSGRSGS